MRSSGTNRTQHNWEAIYAWKDIADGWRCLPAEFLRLMALWESFNCWTRGKYPHAGDLKGLRNIAAEEAAMRCFKELSHEPGYQKRLSDLQQEGPIGEVRGGQLSSRAPSEISDVENLREVLEFIYSVRCNLFHGGKRPGNQRDLRIARVAYNVLGPLFEKLLTDTGTGRP